MPAYRLTSGDFQARFDSLGRLTHLGHPQQIKDRPSPFWTYGPFREGHWFVNCGLQDIFFDPEVAKREHDAAAGTLTLTSIYRDYCDMYGLDLVRSYRIEHGLLRCDFSVINAAKRQTAGEVVSVAPIARLRYQTGIFSRTDFSSDWGHRPYPTNLRTEEEFFWGATISPEHDVIGYFSTSKVDGWHVLYEGPGGQRIDSWCIDFINTLDQHPARLNVQHVRLGIQNPAYHGSFYVGRFASLEAFYQKAADMLGAAFLTPDRCSGFLGETLEMKVIGPADPARTVHARIAEVQSGAETVVEVSGGALAIPLEGKAGWKTITLDAGGYTTEARIWQHAGWRESLRAAARFATTAKHPVAHCAESILGAIALAQAGAYLPDARFRTEVERVLDDAFVTFIDPDTGRHRLSHDRLQNYGSLLDAVRIYQECFDTDRYLEAAQKSARQLMSLQGADGNFYRHATIYNNVIHPVKSPHDWGRHLQTRGHHRDAEDILSSVTQAFRNIADAGDDTQTEGSDHFEDGMTSCSGYQIASMYRDFGGRSEDLQTAEAIYRRRRALVCRVPDSRFFGATLRHWESYWAVGLGPCMLGGHGWNCWSASFAHALFMATGKWAYLLDAYAAICNCLQSIDIEHDTFNFGFVIDPNWRDYYGLGTQYPGEEYQGIPDDIIVTSEAYQPFLTLHNSFYRQTYLHLTAGGVEVLNGRILVCTAEVIDLESYALHLQEIVLVVDDPGIPVPAITVQGRKAAVMVLTPAPACLRA